MEERRQSTNHILMIEPVAFNYNSETGVDNAFQNQSSSNEASIAFEARQEMRRLKGAFLTSGVKVTSFVGQKGCPDEVFPNNWISTSQDKSLYLYPMATPSRSRERRMDVIDALKPKYDFVFDLTQVERAKRSLEGTGVLVLDNIHKEAFIARSKRTDDGLIDLWSRISGYRPIVFDTCDPTTNKPLYHTNVVCHIGTGYAAISPDMIVASDRERVLKELGKNHEVISLSADQIRSFCGNAIEVVGRRNQRYLALSATALASLRPEQVAQYKKHVTDFISSPIPTIEKYGGGSVRCMVCELF